MVELAVQALKLCRGGDVFLHCGIGSRHAQARGLIVDRLLRDQPRERFLGHLLAQRRRYLRRVGVLLRLALKSAAKLLLERGGRDAHAAHGGDRGGIGPAEAELEPHAHFGIPAGARATITAREGEPLVLLDAELVETLS